MDGDGSPAPIATGDLLVLPHDDAHTVRDQPGAPVRGLDRIPAGNPPGVVGRLAVRRFTWHNIPDPSHTPLPACCDSIRPQPARGLPWAALPAAGEG